MTAVTRSIRSTSGVNLGLITRSGGDLIVNILLLLVPSLVKIASRGYIFRDILLVLLHT